MSTLLIVPFAFEDTLPDDEDAWDDGTDSDSTSDHSNDDDDDKDTHNAGKHDQVKADNEPEQPNGIPEKSAVPGQPDKTAKPVEPKKPAEPEQPVKPAEPQQTAKPAEPEPRAASPGKVASEQAVDKSRQDDGSKAGKIVFFPEIFFTCPEFSHSVNRVLGNICAREMFFGVPCAFICRNWSCCNALPLTTLTCYPPYSACKGDVEIAAKRRAEVLAKLQACLGCKFLRLL